MSATEGGVERAARALHRLFEEAVYELFGQERIDEQDPSGLRMEVRRANRLKRGDAALKEITAALALPLPEPAASTGAKFKRGDVTRIIPSIGIEYIHDGLDETCIEAHSGARHTLMPNLHEAPHRTATAEERARYLGELPAAPAKSEPTSEGAFKVGDRVREIVGPDPQVYYLRYQLGPTATPAEVRGSWACAPTRHGSECVTILKESEIELCRDSRSTREESIGCESGDTGRGSTAAIQGEAVPAPTLAPIPPAACPSCGSRDRNVYKLDAMGVGCRFDPDNEGFYSHPWHRGDAKPSEPADAGNEPQFKDCNRCGATLDMKRALACGFCASDVYYCGRACVTKHMDEFHKDRRQEPPAPLPDERGLREAFTVAALAYCEAWKSSAYFVDVMQLHRAMLAAYDALQAGRSS